MALRHQPIGWCLRSTYASLDTMRDAPRGTPSVDVLATHGKRPRVRDQESETVCPWPRVRDCRSETVGQSTWVSFLQQTKNRVLGSYSGPEGSLRPVATVPTSHTKIPWLLWWRSMAPLPRRKYHGTHASGKSTGESDLRVASPAIRFATCLFSIGAWKA